MSFWGKLGKGLLKIAPVAAAFIPGVGPLAAMGIGAATNAISKKASGGSWGDALKSGAVGGAMGALGSVGNTALKGAGGIKGLFGKIGTNLAKNQIKNRLDSGGQQMRQQVGGMGPSNLQRIFATMGAMGNRGYNPTMLPNTQRVNRPYIGTPPFFPPNQGGIGPSNVGYNMGGKSSGVYGPQ
jgi:hypothetical protein